ncbi:hypothetical protein BREVNS_0441 [Brevinematales bacterium NS]|nr:hypothetical protein [Brevinematales bacterium]QJR21191.1 hypothetical protein BREVNS_0441 [Brevinematales bacterium NS]
MRWLKALLWSWWVKSFWRKRYTGKWIVPLWGLRLFLWRERCEKKDVISLKCSLKGILGGSVSVETIYTRKEEKIGVANPCWVSWDTRKDKERQSKEFFCRYLEEQRKKGIEYVVGCAHKRYTEGYWNYFLKGSGYSFFSLGEYRLLFFLPEGAKMEGVVEGRVRGIQRQDVEWIKKEIEARSGFVPQFSWHRWERELGEKGCAETWVYEKEGEILAWVSGWWYTYLEASQKKRGFFLRWVGIERLSLGERVAMIGLLAREWKKRAHVITMPDFVVGNIPFESLGFSLSEERYVIFGVDLQGKGRISLDDFGAFFVF